MTESTLRASILLVDDHAPNLLALRVVLEELGHELVECGSGEAAVEQALHNQFAVVLLDVRMPGMSGFEAARQIRARNQQSRTPIIFLSANDVDSQLLEEGYELGAVDFLIKPLVPTVVRAKVREFVELWQEKQRARREGEQLRLLVDSAQDYAIFVLTPEGNVASWNPGAERIKQYSAAEIIGQHFSKFYPAEAIARDWPAHELREATRLGRFEDEGWRVRKDGTQFWANVVISVLRDDEGRLRGFSKITRDMTERKRNEENTIRLQEEAAARRAAEEHARVIQRQRELLAASEGRHRLLAELAASTQSLVDPEPIMAVAARLLADHLGVERCAYAEVEQETIFNITGNFTRGVPSIVGRWPVADFGAECARQMLAGHVYVVDDVERDSRVTAADLPAYRATQIQAVVCMPLHKDGKFIAAMAVHSSQPRLWTSDEVDLVEIVAGRCWEALERSRVLRQRTLAEDALADSRGRLDYAARISGVGFWYCDLPFDVLRWDQQVREHFWMPADEIVTIESFYDRIHPDDREPTRRAIATSIDQHGPYDIDYRTVDPDTGAIKWVRAMGGTAYAADGTPTRFDGVTVDITATKQAEETLTRALHQEQQQARVLKNLADAALAIHSAGSLESVLNLATEEARRIIDCHQGVTYLLADQENEDITAFAYSKARTRQDFGYWNGDASLAALLANGKRPLRLPGDVSPADRSPPLGLASIQTLLMAPLIGRRGKLLGFIQLSDKRDGDFSDSDESILVQLSHIAAVAIENARLNAELRQQDRRKDEFLATLAHELRNPLAPIRNSLEILKLPRVEEDIARQTREMMERQIQHLIRLVDDLLDVSRVMQGKIELRREKIELSAIVARAVETVQPLLTMQRQELSLSLPQRSLLLNADPVRLAQVLGNLLTNAAKYTDAGGQIWLSAVRDREDVVISVRDNGMGISPSLLPRVFELFVQAEPTATRSQGGLGIGLTLAKNLIELHQGSIQARSAGLGKGAEFQVRLPLLISATAEIKNTESKRPPPPAGGYRLLVVDDNQDAARSLAMLFKLQGHDVKVAHDGASALNLVDTFLPDVVFLDLGMPGMDGFEVARRLRQKPGHAGTVLAALTGWGQREDRERTAEAGFDHHFVKPVEPKAIAWLFDELKKRKS